MNIIIEINFLKDIQMSNLLIKVNILFIIKVSRFRHLPKKIYSLSKEKTIERVAKNNHLTRENRYSTKLDSKTKKIPSVNRNFISYSVE
jgi:hypothetical protein